MSEIVSMRFKNFQSVNIKAINAHGFVFSRLLNSDNEQEYKVKYWIDGTRKEDWFYEFELSDEVGTAR